MSSEEADSRMQRMDIRCLEPAAAAHYRVWCQLVSWVLCAFVRTTGILFSPVKRYHGGSIYRSTYRDDGSCASKPWWSSQWASQWLTVFRMYRKSLELCHNFSSQLNGMKAAILKATLLKRFAILVDFVIIALYRIRGVFPVRFTARH